MGQLPEMKGAFTALVLVCLAVGAGMGKLLPWLWQIVRPFLHAVTA
ncbi:MAG: hypothetical protein KIT35_21745 [Piscinibacter sp.]|nr:hypothetical protein [Piscinibacter sp.]MCW5666463.1 hypothetical protein [Piscinibacter sp.]